MLNRGMHTIRQAIKFFDKEIIYYAAGLSFYTIFAIIPLLLVTLSLITHLPNFEEYYIQIKSFIFDSLIPTKQDFVGQYLDTFLKNSFELGIMGIVYVLGTSLMFFKNYEYIIGIIFRSPPRRFFSSLSTYWTLVTLMPIGIALSIYLTGYAQALLDQAGGKGINLASLLPYLLIWVIFMLLFKISPSREIETKPALLASLITAVVWSVIKSAFLYYVLYNQAFNDIYQSFSAIMFFLLWIYVSWIVLLYGMKLCVLLEDSADEEKPDSQSVL